jgi:hypothetical protein
MNNAMEEYVQQSRKSGMSDDQIRAALVQAGWNPADVDAVLASDESFFVRKGLLIGGIGIAVYVILAVVLAALGKVPGILAGVWVGALAVQLLMTVAVSAMLRIPSRSFSKAFAAVGGTALLSSIVYMGIFLGLPGIVMGILSLVSLIGSIFLFIKAYATSAGRGIFLFILQGIFSVVIVGIAAFVVGIQAILSFVRSSQSEASGQNEAYVPALAGEYDAGSIISTSTPNSIPKRDDEKKGGEASASPSGAPLPKTAPVEGPGVHVDTKYKFSFSYPKDWETEVAGGGEFFRVHPFSQEDYEGTENVGMMFDVGYGSLSSMESSLDEQKIPYAKDSIMMGGVKADRIVYEERTEILGTMRHHREIRVYANHKNLGRKDLEVTASCVTAPDFQGICSHAIDDAMNKFIIPSFKFL